MVPKITQQRLQSFGHPPQQLGRPTVDQRRMLLSKLVPISKIVIPHPEGTFQQGIKVKPVELILRADGIQSLLQFVRAQIPLSEQQVGIEQILGGTAPLRLACDLVPSQSSKESRKALLRAAFPACRPKIERTATRKTGLPTC